MKRACCTVLLTVALSGCASHQKQPAQVERDAKVIKYFERYCDYSGNMGIEFVASHTYDFEFRQRTKTTSDTELRRLFVLQHLYRELDSDISEFERGAIRTGKSLSRPMSAEERAASHSRIDESLADLSVLDPGDHSMRLPSFASA